MTVFRRYRHRHSPVTVVSSLPPSSQPCDSCFDVTATQPVVTALRWLSASSLTCWVWRDIGCSATTTPSEGTTAVTGTPLLAGENDYTHGSQGKGRGCWGGGGGGGGAGERRTGCLKAPSPSPRKKGGHCGLTTSDSSSRQSVTVIELCRKQKKLLL